MQPDVRLFAALLLGCGPAGQPPDAGKEASIADSLDAWAHGPAVSEPDSAVGYESNPAAVVGGWTAVVGRIVETTSTAGPGPRADSVAAASRRTHPPPR
jgi:hypothetical protein